MIMHLVRLNQGNSELIKRAKRELNDNVEKSAIDTKTFIGKSNQVFQKKTEVKLAEM